MQEGTLLLLGNYLVGPSGLCHLEVVAFHTILLAFLGVVIPAGAHFVLCLDIAVAVGPLCIVIASLTNQIV